MWFLVATWVLLDPTAVSMIAQTSMIVLEMAHAWNLIFVRATQALKAQCAWISRVKHEVVVQVSARRFINAGDTTT
jgi:hypothetical protein